MKEFLILVSAPYIALTGLLPSHRLPKKIGSTFWTLFVVQLAITQYVSVEIHGYGWLRSTLMMLLTVYVTLLLLGKRFVIAYWLSDVALFCLLLTDLLTIKQYGYACLIYLLLYSVRAIIHYYKEQSNGNI